MSTVAYHPRVWRLALLNSAGVGLVALGLFLLSLEQPEAGDPILVILLRLLGMALLLVATPATLMLTPPLVQGTLRRSATLELVEDGIVLAVGFDQQRKVSWSDISQVDSVRLKPPLTMGWVTIAFVRPRQRLGKELSLPDLYLDRQVDEVAETMNSMLERWRYPFGRPKTQGTSP